MDNPVLVELTRGGRVESRHRGAFAVARADGSLVASSGDVATRVYPRSAIKAFQCLPVIESGAADAYGFVDADIALACASHSGSEAHAARAAAMLARAGLTPDVLGCGAHWPLDDAVARRLARVSTMPIALHNNCSGKHAAMLCMCRHAGDPVRGYLDRRHAHQQRIAAVLSDLAGAAFDEDEVGIDGCSAPNWALPLSTLAMMFARFVTGEGLSATRSKAAQRILAAAWSAPDCIAGEGRYDTRVLAAYAGRVFLKTGAEGVYCGALPELGFGFAVKIDDGAKRASEAATGAIIAAYVADAADLATAHVQRNWRGTETGELRARITFA
jgi:L-asparaginase II